MDAVDAYNQRLVKRIEVKGFQVKNFRGTDKYLYLESIIVSPKHPPRARIEFEVKYDKSINREMRILSVDDNLYELSKSMEQYRGYRISEIDPIAGSVTFTNGEVIHKGDVVGDISEKDMRRIQIRETIIGALKPCRYFLLMKLLSIVHMMRKVQNCLGSMDGCSRKNIVMW